MHEKITEDKRYQPNFTGWRITEKEVTDVVDPRKQKLSYMQLLGGNRNQDNLDCRTLEEAQKWELHTFSWVCRVMLKRAKRFKPVHLCTRSKYIPFSSQDS